MIGCPNIHLNVSKKCRCFPVELSSEEGQKVLTLVLFTNNCGFRTDSRHPPHL